MANHRDRGFFRRGVEGRKSRRCSSAKGCAGVSAKQAEIRIARIMALKKKRNAKGRTLRTIAPDGNSNVQTKSYTQAARLL
jgi:hypothetical protein